jgi:DNA-binding response OmpR family regulator
MCRMSTESGVLPGDRRAARAAPLRILIVEDEMMLAMMLQDAVAGIGHKARKASRLDKAFELVNAHVFDAAVLDVNLNGEPVFPLAALLRERGVPFLFASGYGDAGVPRGYGDCMVLQKPYGLDAFHAALRDLLGSKGTSAS